MSVSSFDIFDTVLTRRLAKPSDVFLLLGDALHKEGIRVPAPRVFKLLRMRCERWSRRFEPSREVTLADIHRLLARLLFWSEADQVRAAELERDIESDVLRITPRGGEAVKTARRNGGRIAFVSDMYLEEEFLRSVLRREGLFEDGDLLAVSGEWKVSKAGGSIWPRLIQKLGVDGDRILHRGDNPHSDVDSPRKAGISSERLGTAEVSRWEDWPEGYRVEDLRRQGGIAALSRLARAGFEDPDEYWTCLGAGVLGPMLAGFAAWALRDARKKGIDTLWVHSRDGWLMLESARLMSGDEGPKLEYLCIGRRQLALASMEPVNLGTLFEGSRSQTLRLVGSRLALRNQDLLELATGIGLAAEDLDQSLSDDHKSAIRSLFFEPDWQLRLEKARQKASASAMGYLRQMAARVGGSVGVVDVGWQGRSQDQLSRLMPELGRLSGYYLGCSGRENVDCPKAGWIYDFAAGTGSRALHDHQRVFEVLIGGVAGPLRGYVFEEGSWSADFEEMETGETAPGRERAQRAALEFVKLASDPAYADWWSAEDLRDFSVRNLDRLFLHPNSLDAKKFQEWTASTDEAHLDSVPLVKGFDLPRIIACLRKEQPWAFLWPEAALLNSTWTGRCLMSVAWRAFKWIH